MCCANIYHTFTFMKWSLFILSFYILVLSCVPCGDTDNCEKSQKSETVSNHFEGNHNHEQEADLCTPFCLCACCGGFIFSIDLNIPEFIRISYFLKSEVFHLSTSIFSFSYTIWQPPKLV